MADDVKITAAPTPDPVPLTPHEVGRLAKTGCRTCHGGGRIIVERQIVGRGRNDVIVWAMCACVVKRVGERDDVGDWNGRLCWVPGREPGKREAPVPEAPR